MAGTYEIWLTTDTGSRLLLLDDLLAAFFTRVANGIAPFMLRLPASFDTKLLRRDRMIQCWRKPRGGRLSLFRAYFIRWWNFRRQGTDLVIEVRGRCVNDLLRRRHVINYAGTAGSDKTDFADDLMKEIADEQMVTDSSDPVAGFGSRTVPDFSIQVDLSDGSTLTQAFAWRRVSELLADIGRSSRAPTPEVFFDVVVSDVGPPITLQFRTRIDQPGLDRTADVVFDEARGNLVGPSYTFDALDEENYVYGGGQGTGTDRNVQQVWDAARVNASRYNRCEGFAFGAFANSDDAVREAARERLENGQPREIFTGRPVDTEGTRFGRDWNWGDKVTARFLGQEYEPIIRKLTIYLDQSGKEHIDTRLEYFT